MRVWRSFYSAFVPPSGIEFDPIINDGTFLMQKRKTLKFVLTQVGRYVGTTYLPVGTVPRYGTGT